MKCRFLSKPWPALIGWAGILVLLIFGGVFCGSLAKQWIENKGGLGQVGINFANGGSVGVWGPVTLTFTADMNVDSVEQAIRIQPELEVDYQWTGNVLSIVPQKSMEIGTVYTLTLLSGAKSQAGSVLRRGRSWTFQVRPVSLVYLQRQQENTTGELVRATVEGDTVVLTATGERVLDFGVARDGEQIVYSAKNDQGGADLWKIDRNGKQAGLMISCGPDRCDQPAWSPDGSLIAYRQTGPGKDPDSQGTIWIWEVATQTGHILSSDMNRHGAFPTWAPVGRRLASIDTTAETIHIIDLNGMEQFAIPARSGLMGAWSPDGKKFVYVDVQNSSIQPAYNLFIADLYDGSIAPAPINQSDLLELGSPQYSPDGKGITINARPVAAPMGKQIWWIQADGNITTITNDMTMTYSAYTWSPAGDWLAFQQFEMGSSHSTPQIAIWQRGDSANDTGQSRVIAENAVQPEWLP